MEKKKNYKKEHTKKENNPVQNVFLNPYFTYVLHHEQCVFDLIDSSIFFIPYNC